MSENTLFEQLLVRPTTDGELDAVLAESDAPALTILFLWGRNCPNCDIAKAALRMAPDRFRWPDVRWLQDNVYEDPGMATRFGLHGIPVFLLFRGRRPIGRITSWPGQDAFVTAIEGQRARLAG